ncbi:RNA-directed DNA polymerase, eukaryota [Artemisia annua]|uniref:RNA-directed DNA polymerase, eukaryota n=1 Tax=Artemisia annua TaxID=35608 RepID=A0A2U1LE00_ARTAN|nr:RNA-directed DNA polymerase, eukaryota [Artemisia annua]
MKIRVLQKEEAPCKVIKDLESITSRFLWGGSKEVRKIHWVSWEKVCSPKKFGGLGLSNFKFINIALLSKWGWRYKKERGNLWCDVIEACHSSCRSWDFLPVRKILSGVWSNVVKVLSRTMVSGLPIRRLFKGIVGNGNNISFWIDPWLLNIPLMCICPNLFRLETEKRCKVSDRIKRIDSGYCRVWKWKGSVLDVEVRSEWEILNSLLVEVKLSDSIDGWGWIGIGKGVFSISAVRNMLYDDMNISNASVFEWCKWIPKKCNIFGWRADMDRIPTMCALRSRNIPVSDVSCVLCGDSEESLEHLFTGCIFASRIWSFISSWCKTQSFFVFSFKDLLEFHKYSGLSGIAKDILYGIIIISCWCIWRARNNFKFQSKKAKVEVVIGEIKVLGFLWAKSRAKVPSLDWDRWCKFPSVSRRRYSSIVAASVASTPAPPLPEKEATEKSAKWSFRFIKSFAMGELEARKLKFNSTGTEALLMGILVEGETGEVTTSHLLLGIWAQKESAGHKIMATLGFDDDKAQELAKSVNGQGNNFELQEGTLMNQICFPAFIPKVRAASRGVIYRLRLDAK